MEAYEVFISEALEAGRGVTEGDLEAVPAVNSRTHGRIRHTHTRERRAIWEPTGSWRGHYGDGTGFR